MSDKKTPLRYDLMSIAGHATSEYGLDEKEIAETLREMADEIEDNRNIKLLFAGSNQDNTEQ